MLVASDIVVCAVIGLQTFATLALLCVLTFVHLSV